MTKQYGILAYPASHSLSPVIHNTAFEALSIDAQYGIFEIPENELSEFMERVINEPVSGLSVSLPYKEMILNFMNNIDEDARKIGAVNTVVNKGGFLYGYNTDFLGATRALKEKLSSLKGRKVVVIGAGGSAKAIVYGLIKEGAEVTVINRTKEKADQIAANFGDSVRSAEFDKNTLGEILIHTSSIWTGNNSEELPFFCEADYVKNFQLVMDIAYTPLITPLLKVAQNLGIEFITGDKMLLYQAEEQFKLWTNEKAPLESMRKALELQL